MRFTDDCKKKCQIFTPETNVNEMLDWLGYTNDLFGKKIIEPSCGQGNILVKIVERYIEDSIKKGYSKDNIKEGLTRDIYGIEYDERHFKRCMENLSAILNKYNIKDIKWNIYCDDALNIDLKNNFDYVIGNPPYISYKMLDNQTREFVRKKFNTCKKGKFDYCYPFIEKGIELLKIGGKIAYLVPGSIFKNVFSKDLREFMKKDITNIYDYDTQKLFNEYATGERKKILTSSVVFILKKGCNNNFLEYTNLETKNKNIISKEELKEKWIFENTNNGNKRFGDYFKVSNSIATLYNKAYVVNENDVIYNNIEEKAIIKNAVSPKSIEKNKKEKIIFPYLYDKKGMLKKIKEDEIHKKYPSVEKHLKQYEYELNQRKSDKNIKWYEYGRSQALNDMNKKKLLISILVTGKVKVYKLSKETIPYSGIYIIPKKNLSLEEAKKILESEKFYNYIKSVGINASGDSYRITSKDISNYYF